MHVYEGWQVTPFHNLIQLDQKPTPQQVEAIRIQNGNSGWLRSVALTLLTGFQNLGLALISTAIYGVNAWTLSLIIGTLFISLIGPKLPLVQDVNFEIFGKRFGDLFYRSNRFDPDVKQPFFPIPASLFLALLVNGIVNAFANIHLFNPVFSAPGAWPPSLLPFLSFIPVPIGAIIASLSSPLLIAFGGIWEGVIAETSFLQKQHLLAFLILLSGLGLVGVQYWHLVEFYKTVSS
jgi:hypothetical protein